MNAATISRTIHGRLINARAILALAAVGGFLAVAAPANPAQAASLIGPASSSTQQATDGAVTKAQWHHHHRRHWHRPYYQPRPHFHRRHHWHQPHRYHHRHHGYRPHHFHRRHHGH